MADNLQAAKLELAKRELASRQSIAPTRPKQGILGKTYNAVGGFFSGAFKEGAAAPYQVGQAIGTAGTAIAKAVTGKKDLVTGIPQVPESLKPQGTAEKIGALGTTIAETFTPTGLGSAGVKAIGLLPKLSKGAPIIAKIGTVLAKMGIKGTVDAIDLAAKTYLQTGGNLQKTKDAAIAGGIFGSSAKALEEIAPGIIQPLVKSGFKLSPAQEAKIAKKADAAAKFISDNKILGSDETKYSKLVTLNSELESTLQQSLSAYGEVYKVNKQAIIDNITASIESLKKSDPAIYKSAKADADAAIKLLKSEKGKTLDISQVLNSKRSYGQAAFKTAKFAIRDPRVVSEGSYAIEQGFQKALEDTLNSVSGTISIPPALQYLFSGKTEATLSDFNKVYSNAVNSKNLTNLARFKNDSGLIGRLFGLWAGESVGQAIAPGLPGKIIGGATGEILSSKLPGTVRNLGERALSTPPGVITGAAKVKTGLENQ